MESNIELYPEVGLDAGRNHQRSDRDPNPQPHILY